MDARLRQAVRQRAGDRCEYCRLPQNQDFFHPFHVEHIRPRQHGGSGDLQNLAWACHRCNLHKGTNLTGIDPDTNETVLLFHPRRDAWPEHFAWDGPRIIGQSAIGRTTVWLLQMNADERVELRRLFLELGEL